MEAKDVMTVPVVTVGPDTPTEELAKLMLDRHISAIPVVDAAGRLQGIVSEGDLMRHAGAGTGRHGSWWLSLFADRDQMASEYTKSHGRTAGDVMSTKVVTATENTPLDRIATLLERHRIKRVPIVRRGKVVGIVSRANLLHGLVALKPALGKTVVKDRDIRNRILGELEKAGVDKAYVNVVVSKGVVELWGMVGTAVEKRALAIAAKNEKGVQKVVDNIYVATQAIKGALGE